MIKELLKEEKEEKLERRIGDLFYQFGGVGG